MKLWGWTAWLTCGPCRPRISSMPPARPSCISLRWWDGHYQPDDYRNLAGQANQVPVMVGSTKNDGLGWVDPPTTAEQYTSDLAHLFFEQAPVVGSGLSGLRSVRFCDHHLRFHRTGPVHRPFDPGPGLCRPIVMFSITSPTPPEASCGGLITMWNCPICSG